MRHKWANTCFRGVETSSKQVCTVCGIQKDNSFIPARYIVDGEVKYTAPKCTTKAIKYIKMKLEKLTPEQETKLNEVRAFWLNYIFSCKNTVDREAAKIGINWLYKTANLNEPVVIYVDSPLACQFAVVYLKEYLKVLGMNNPDQVEAQVGDQVWAQVGDQVMAQVRAQVWAQVGAQVGDQVWDQVGDQVGEAMYGQHDSGWLSFYAFFAKACGFESAKRLEPLTRVAASCGWVWMFSGAAIMTDRPHTLRRDSDNRLHCENGPAVEYRDGFSIYAWHGTRVPAHWIEQRESLSPAEVLASDNVEQRAAGAAIIGWPKMMEVLDAKVIDSDPDPDHGDLIEMRLPGLPEPGLFLRAYCKRNGLICEGVPRVSDIDGKPIKTVRAAQAWSFGKREDEFQYPDFVS